ncbi:MAG: hypothetical protein MJ066_05860 [Clostridia bacterium]|nr:hypothetical protein [Clostridia bacterium]
MKKNETKTNTKRIMCCEITTRLKDDDGKTLLDMKRFEKALSIHSTIKMYSWILHDKDTFTQIDKDKNDEQFENCKIGKPKPKHIHAVLEFNTAIKVSSIAKWFGINENRIEYPSRSDKNFAREKYAYQTHRWEDKTLLKFVYKENEVHIKGGTDRDEWFESVNTWKKANVNNSVVVFNENMLDEYLHQVEYDGYSLDLLKKKIRLKNYYKNERYFLKARENYLFYNAPLPSTRHNFYIDANERDNNTRSATGKSLFTKCLACYFAKEYIDNYENYTYDELKTKKIIYEVGDKKVAFQKYDGEPIIVFNDLSNYDIKEMLGHRNIKNVFELFPTRFGLDKKYGDICIIAKYILVNGIEPFETFVNGIAGKYKDRNGDMVNEEADTEQYFRRFVCNAYLEDDNTIRLNWNKGVLENTKEYRVYKTTKMYFNINEALKCREAYFILLENKVKTKLLEYEKLIKNKNACSKEEKQKIKEKIVLAQKQLDEIENKKDLETDLKGNALPMGEEKKQFINLVLNFNNLIVDDENVYRKDNRKKICSLSFYNKNIEAIRKAYYQKELPSNINIKEITNGDDDLPF